MHTNQIHKTATPKTRQKGSQIEIQRSSETHVETGGNSKIAAFSDFA